MLSRQDGKVAVAALGALLAGTGLGWVPVARFVAPKAKPTPPKPVDPVIFTPPPVTTNSKGSTKIGPLTVDAMLSQSRVVRGADGYLYVDVKLTADATQETGDRRPIDFALVLDVSGSMAEENKIGLMKQACLDLARRLTPQDRVAVVSFSTAARTIFGLQRSSAAYEQAIRQLVANGGTNISDGLALGAEELRRAVRPGAARRIILLTDGHPSPNLGDSTPEGLNGIVKRLQQQGISVTTVGLGLDYNSKLLSDMAESGGGSYHYVDSGARIAGIYDAELRSLRTLVARGVTVTLEGTNGAEVQDLIEWNADRSGSKLTINAGDFESGRATKIVARLRASSTTGPMLRVTVRGEDAVRQQTLAPVSLALGAEVTDDAALAAASTIEEAKKDVEDAQVGDLLEKARARAERGDAAGARGYFEQLKGKRATVAYEARDGKVESMDVDKLQKAYESGDREEQLRALQFSRSAASKASR